VSRSVLSCLAGHTSKVTIVISVIIQVKDTGQFLGTCRYPSLMSLNLLIHIFGVWLLLDPTDYIWSLNEATVVILRTFCRLSQWLRFAIEALLELLFVLNLFHYLVCTDFNLLQNVTFIAFCLNFDRLVHHFTQLIVPLIQLAVSLQESIVSWGV
jgi:hypothetical protein